MRTNKRLILVFSLFAIILTSCDPGVKYTKVVQNSSDFDITVYIYPELKVGDGSFFKFDTIRINNHTEASVYEVSGLGQTFEYEDCNTYADTIFARVIGIDTLNSAINLNDKSKWIFSVLDKTYKEGGVCECRAIITNDMIK